MSRADAVDTIRKGPVLRIAPRRFGDDRGWFQEVYGEERFRGLGIDCHFVQDNQSMSRAAGTMRGIHFQLPPHAQAKLVRCQRGRIMDYAIDLRRGSPTFGRHVSAELTADGGEQLFIPVGFGHAFVTLEPDTEVAYKVSDIYAPDLDAGISWNDPVLGLAWPLPGVAPTLSDKDRALQPLAAFASPFAYGGDPLMPLDG